MLKKKSQINVFDWYLELAALIFLALAIIMVYSITSPAFKFLNIFISGLICGYILFRRQLGFRVIFITIAWIIGLIIGSKLNAFYVILVFLIGIAVIYYSLKKKWIDV